MPIITNIGEFKEEIRRVKISLVSQRADVLLKVASDVLALTKRRVQQTGINSDGDSFEGYTTPYSKVRKKKGLQIQRVDFTDTGRMWTSIRPELIENTQERTVIEVKPSTQAEQDKLNGQFKKRGNILLPSAEELRIAQEIAEECVEEILNQL